MMAGIDALRLQDVAVHAADDACPDAQLLPGQGMDEPELLTSLSLMGGRSVGLCRAAQTLRAALSVAVA